MKISKLKKISLTHEIQLFNQKDSVKTFQKRIQTYALKSGKKVGVANREERKARELLIRAIALNPNDSVAYNNLGCKLKSGEKVRLANGEEWGKCELYIRAIALNPNNSMVYNNLGNMLKSDEKVWLENGEEWGKRELYMRAIGLDPNNPDTLTC